MQPIYITLNSSGSSVWKIPNWHATPQQISFAINSSGGSSWFLDVTFQDPGGTFGSTALSTAPVAFTILTGSSNQFIGIGPGSTTGLTVIAGYRFTLNTLSSVGAPTTLLVNQAGIG